MLGLIVTEAFGPYSRGDQISTDAEIVTALKGNGGSVMRVQLPDPPKPAPVVPPTPAPAVVASPLSTGVPSGPSLAIPPKSTE